MTPVSALRCMTAAAALTALAGCVAAPPATREFSPQAPAGEGAPAQAAPIDVAVLDPLNAPPPPAAASDAMLVPAPDANSSQRVPLNTLAPSGTPSAPTSLLTPPGQTPPRAAAPAMAAPMTAAPTQAPASVPPAPSAPMQVAQIPAGREFEPAPVAPPAQAKAPVMAPAVAPTVQPTTPPVRVEPPALRLRPPEGTSPAALTPSEDATVVISSATTRSMQPREFVPASLTPAPTIAAPGPGDRPLSAAEKNTIQRFETLKRLEDEALITHDEYLKRRNANAGGLLPYTHQPEAEGLGRPVPSADAIVARIAALRRSFEMRAITPQQHALERTMILNALLPENPTDRADPMPPPKDMIEGAAAAGHLERLREKNLITAEELQAEKDAIEHAVTTGLLPSQEAGRAAAARRTGTAASRAAPAPAGKAAAAGPQVSPMEREITGPVVHIASYRSEASALKGWEEVISKNKALLTGVQPIVRRVDLGDQGTFYRLMAGSYGSMGEAEAACIKLKESGQFCRASATGS